MLPDFPTIKRQFSDALNRFLRERLRHHLGPIASFPTVTFHEGSRSAVSRKGSAFEPSGLELIHGEAEFSIDKLATMTISDVLDHYDRIAEQVAAGMAGNVLKKFKETTEQLGRVVGSPATAFSIAGVLDCVERMDIDFNPDGTPKQQQLWIHPDLGDAVKRAIEEAASDPTLRKRHEEIIARKREEWRDREASRKLVG